ncbi:MAG: hypothetical protein VYB09_02340 [Planctomycetota bacterium]|nr:hypothetical protein [Planctomycetota bacterium]
MERANWLTCFWPGLSRLWIKGHWSGLFAALLFAGLLNLAIASRFIWPELLPPVLALSLWAGVAGFWIHGFFQSWRQMPLLTASPPVRRVAGSNEEQTEDDVLMDGHDEDLFESAQQEYLKQNWYEAETLLRKLLQACESDIHARLMLAALYRHNGRREEAEVELKRASRSEASRKWDFEIKQQQMLLKNASLVDEDETDSNKSLQPAA